ncbi:MAG: YlbF family regulator [Clostridiales bacterium]|uniref:YlbF family regulator n=1 Tax=Oscillospiraceae TaxID=216572 RepID=UPI0009A865CD|nr:MULTISPECIES: YlbF family regulator [Oscillospiraceae]PWM39889.1 MAG: YlbF family regulator [Clostridiales bacterium]RGB68689.1 YlbF family regulator [Harryflintia acetispora]
MDIIKMARELGKAIQQDDKVIAYNLARQHNDSDEKLQELIGKFNLKRLELNNVLGKADRDTDRIAQLDKEIKEIYAEVMNNPNMIAYNTTKQEVDRMMNFVTQILTGSVNGEDPDSIEEQTGCSGSCEGCSGCH